MQNNLLLPFSDDALDLIALHNIESAVLSLDETFLDADQAAGIPALQPDLPSPLDNPSWFGKHWTEMTDQELQEAGDAGYFADSTSVNPAEMTDDQWDAYRELGS